MMMIEYKQGNGRKVFQALSCPKTNSKMMTCKRTIPVFCCFLFSIFFWYKEHVNARSETHVSLIIYPN